MAESATSDISEDVLPLPPLLDDDVEPEVETIGIEDNRTEMEKTEPMMEHLKEVSLQQENIPDTSSVVSDISFPHDQWTFNRLIVKISKSLSKKDLEYMKEMYKNEIGRGVLASIDSPTQLFDKMQTRNFLSPVNLLQLEGLLWDLERKDLLQLVIEYAQQTKNVIYMHPATNEPVNGYTHVKFHISGKDFTKMTKGELGHIRAVVASILAMPMKFVLIDGVDPSTSVTVTILLPNVHAKVLHTLLIDNATDVKMLIHVGIDRITLDGHVYVISDLNLVFESDSFEQIQKQTDVFGKYQDAKKVLSCYEMENVNLKKEIEDLKTELMILKADIAIRKGCALPVSLAEYKERLNEDSSGIKSQSEEDDIGNVLENFSTALRQTSEAGYDKQLVLKLLNAHVTIIATRCYHELASVINQQNQQVKELVSGLVIHKALFEVRRYMGDGTDDEPAEIKALKDISKKLQPKEKEQLVKNYELTNDDKEVIREGSVPFLLIIMHKEFQRSENVVNIIDFLRQCLLKIGRTDLLLQFHIERVRYEQENETHDAKHESNKRGSVNSEVQVERKDREQTLDDMASDMKRLLKDVEAIKTTMKDFTETCRHDNVANMKNEYLNLLYKTPTVQTSK